MKDIILTIGHNVEGEPCHSMRSVCAKASELLGVEAFTAIPCVGMWRGQAEDSTRIELCAVSEAEASRICALVPDLAEALGQAEIMREVRTSHVRFIERSSATEALTA